VIEANPPRLRAPFKYYGGKGHMIAKIVPLIPDGKVYVEPYCGAASIFFSKPPHSAEVLNDLNGDIVNLFRVLQDKESFEECRHRIMYTPYARAEFARALEMISEPVVSSVSVDRAWAWFVAKNQGFSGTAKSVGDWGRAFTSSGGVAKNVNSWLMRQSLLDAWRHRLMTTQIDSRDALEVIRYWDSPETVFYCDPPYVIDTRAKGSRAKYKHECQNDHHASLLDALLGLKGKAVVSGYDHALYEPLAAAGWECKRFSTDCRASNRGRGSKVRGPGNGMKHSPRTECAWVSPGAESEPSSIHSANGKAANNGKARMAADRLGVHRFAGHDPVRFD